MNILHLSKLSIIVSLLFLSTACSTVGDVVSSTGDLVSKTGEIIGGKKEEIKAPEIELPELPQVIEIKEEKPATAQIQIRTTDKISQSRINVIVIQLKSEGKFSSSRLSDLESDTESALGSDFINKQNVSLKKGESKSLSLEIDPETKAIGAFASYQELNQTIWRTSVQLPKATDTTYNIQINVDNKLISASKK